MAKKNLQRAGNRMEERKEFDEEVIQIDRVTRVVKGGRRLRFRVTVAIGDRRGRVGIGTGKATEVVTGIKKAVSAAKKSLVHVALAEGDTIPHPVLVKYKAVKLMMMPASPGTGVIAGGALRKVLSLAGVKNVLSKNFGSRNGLVMAQASLNALRALRPPKKPATFTSEPARKADMEVKREQRRKPIPKRVAPAVQAEPAPTSTDIPSDGVTEPSSNNS